LEIAAEFACSFLEQNNLIPGYDPLQHKLILQYVVNWFFLYTGGCFFYFLFASLSYGFFFVYKKDKYYPASIKKSEISKQIQTEIYISMTSMPFTAVLIAPFATAVQRGNAKIYYNVSEYGWGYFFFKSSIIPFCN